VVPPLRSKVKVSFVLVAESVAGQVDGVDIVGQNRGVGD
jgi:hypothetical protein